MENDELLTPAELAERLKVTEREVKWMRNNGEGPAHLRLGHRTVRYRESDVDAWLKTR